MATTRGQAPTSTHDARIPVEWQAWVLENLALGVPPHEVAAGLVERGLDAAEATTEVAALHEGPTFALAARLAERARRCALVLELREALHAQRGKGEVPRRHALSADTFFSDFYAANRPVILTDVMGGWPAVGRWGPAYFASRFGDVDVEVCIGREGARAPDRDFARHTTTMPLGRFAQLVGDAPRTNDLYMIANNRAMERPALRGLLDDVTIPTHLIDAARLDGALTLWFGPAGTRTPAHHDTCNILFCQVTGRKRVRLVPPDVDVVLHACDGFYASPEAWGSLDTTLVSDVVLEPGEALFLPVGWWHEVEALDVSVTLSFTRFVAPNAFPWFTPGVAPKGPRAPR